MSDIVERLNVWAPMIESKYDCPAAGPVMREAADEIERLRAEGKELREHIDAIKWTADYHKSQNCMEIQIVIIKQRDEAWEEVERLRAIVARYDAERTQISPGGASRAVLAGEKKDAE